MKDKKGISPLIATVLIIGFTIVAAILVITWINSLIGEQTDDQACKADALEGCIYSQGVFEFNEIGDAASVEASITNGGSEDARFEAIFLNTTGDSICGANDNSMNISGFSTTISTVCDDGDAAQIKFVQLVDAVYEGISCTATCGEGTTIDIT